MDGHWRGIGRLRQRGRPPYRGRRGNRRNPHRPGRVRSFTFTKTGGIIYGDTDGTHTPGSAENTATNGNTNGHAVYHPYYYDVYYRDATLYAADNISTSDTMPGSSGETVGNWTMK